VNQHPRERRSTERYSTERRSREQSRRGRGARDRGSSDRGAASLFVLALGLVLVAAGLAGAAVGAARVGRHQARLAADLGALAGAVRVTEGESAACGRAAELVAANNARMTSCRVDGLDLVVTAEVTVTPLPGLVRAATAAARAGPVTDVVG
jgi:secretion/DNA translocation related TadE-like protein